MNEIEFAPFFELIAQVAQEDDIAETRRIGCKLLKVLHTDPRFAALPDNIWHDVPAMPN